MGIADHFAIDVVFDRPQLATSCAEINGGVERKRKWCDIRLGDD
jgi:hypothetical protein